MLHLRRHVGPHAKIHVFLLTFESKLLLLVPLDLPVMRLLFLLKKLLIRVLSVVLDVSENILRDLIILRDHDSPYFLHIVLAPLDLLMVVLRECLSVNKLKTLNYIFSDLAVTRCLTQSFVFALSPQGNEGGQVLLVVGIWQRVAGDELVVQVLDPRLDGQSSLADHGCVPIVNEWRLLYEPDKFLLLSFFLLGKTLSFGNAFTLRLLLSSFPLELFLDFAFLFGERLLFFDLLLGLFLRSHNLNVGWK